MRELSGVGSGRGGCTRSTSTVLVPEAGVFAPGVFWVAPPHAAVAAQHMLPARKMRQAVVLERGMHLPSHVACRHDYYGCRIRLSKRLNRCSDARIRAGLGACAHPKQARVPASMLRFCERKGLIQAVSRRGLRRWFEPAVFEHWPWWGSGSPPLSRCATGCDEY